MTANLRSRMTRDNTAVRLIDHQVGLLTGTSRWPSSSTTSWDWRRPHRCWACPIVATTTGPRQHVGTPIPELQAALGNLDNHDRPMVSAWDDEAFVAKIRQTGRDHLILAGLAFETCASLAAIAARTDGH
jgi:nicotinamidase-related amidase